MSLFLQTQGSRNAVATVNEHCFKIFYSKYYRILAQTYTIGFVIFCALY